VNRPYVFRGREVPGVYQRCTSKCGADKCDRHKWQFEVELQMGPNGQRERVTKGGFDTPKEAADAKAEVVRLHKQGTLSKDRKMTVATWLPMWLDARIERGELRVDTAADYRDSIERYLVPRLGNLKLADIRGAHMTVAYDAMRRDRAKAIKAAQEINVQRRAEAVEKNRVKHSGRPRVPHLVPVPRPLGPLTMRRIHNVLSGALKSAVKGGLIPRNPAPDAELPDAVQPKVKVWTAEQLGKFLDAIEGQRLYAMYHLAAFAGMRRGELCGLSWDDVDLDAGRIIVRWQITDKHYREARRAEKRDELGSYRTKPKTRAGEDRVVDLDADSVKALVAWHAQQQKEAEDWGTSYINIADDDGPYNLVFTRENGAPLDPGLTYSTFVGLVKDAGLSHLKLHGLRHINISLQLDAGVSETVIAMRVGHTSPALIRSTYGHLIGTVGQRAAEATASLVPRKAKIEAKNAKKAKKKAAKAKDREKKGRKDTGAGEGLAEAS
jgi:integrase